LRRDTKRYFLLLLVVFVLVLHLLPTSTGYFHDRNGLTPLFCPNDTQTPFSFLLKNKGILVKVAGFEHTSRIDAHFSNILHEIGRKAALLAVPLV
jgi:hypothetical protein